MLVDLRPKETKGKATEKALDRASITCNKNGIPNDTALALRHFGHPPRHPGGHDARLWRRPSSAQIGGLIAEVVEGLRKNGEEGDAQIEASVARGSRSCAPASRSIKECERRSALPVLRP